MRVALVIGSYDAFGGGAERWTDRHARMLLDRGYEVHLVARNFRGAPEGAICEVVSLPRAGGRRRMSFGEAAEGRLRDLACDIVHDMGDGWYSDIFMPHHGTRRGTFKHNNRHLPPLVRRARLFANKWVPRYREFRAIERRQYDPGAGHVYLAVSNLVRRHMLRYYHVPDDRIRVVYNGVDVDGIRPPTDDGARRVFRAGLGAGSHTLFLMVAHNFKLKGLDTTLRALALLRRAGQGVSLVVVGNGAVNQYLGIARSLGVDDIVRFVGDQPDPLPYYQSADVFVLPTYYDPCSLVVLEAMAAGLPIITTRNNGVHELMTPGLEGEVILDPSNPEELAAAMELYCSEHRRVECGRAARALAEQNSTAEMFRRHIELYDEIVMRRDGAESGPGRDKIRLVGT